MMKIVKNKNSRGQMLLVVVLTMIVALTVALSIASRTITNLKISTQSEQSQRAFQAAEAGVEQVLQSGAGSSSNPLTNNAKYSTSVTYPSGTFLLNGGQLVDQDTGVDVWLSHYPDFTAPISGSYTLYWGTNTQSDCTGASGATAVKSAIEVVVLSGSKLSPTMNKYFFDSCSGRITNAASPGVGGTFPGTTVNFSSSTSISVGSGLIMRVIPIFNSAVIGILTNTGSTALPTQGTTVDSVGSAGDTVRKVEYFASYPQIPLEVFPYSLISQ